MTGDLDQHVLGTLPTWPNSRWLNSVEGRCWLLATIHDELAELHDDQLLRNVRMLVALEVADAVAEERARVLDRTGTT